MGLKDFGKSFRAKAGGALKDFGKSFRAKAGGAEGFLSESTAGGVEGFWEILQGHSGSG